MDDSYDIEVSVPIPRDADGFIRRECPHCMRQFKWHDGPANEEAEQHAPPVTYSCPLCGQPAAVGSWDTAEQVELAQHMAMPQVMEMIHDELQAAFRGIRGITYKRGRGETFDQSHPLTEPNDMVIVVSPCHGYEPVKVPAWWISIAASAPRGRP